MSRHTKVRKHKRRTASGKRTTVRMHNRKLGFMSRNNTKKRITISKTLLIGWSQGGRPFSKQQFENSSLKNNDPTFTYPQYLNEFSRQYKNPTLRKSLTQR